MGSYFDLVESTDTRGIHVGGNVETVSLGETIGAVQLSDQAKRLNTIIEHYQSIDQSLLPKLVCAFQLGIGPGYSV